MWQINVHFVFNVVVKNFYIIFKRFLVCWYKVVWVLWVFAVVLLGCSQLEGSCYNNLVIAYNNH